jgi:hypothetical protein
MTTLQAAKIVCSFSTVPTAPLSPFVWGILKTLQTFGQGERPSFENLSDKLAVDNASFFSQGWSEAVDSSLVDCDDFQAASLTERSCAALTDGFIQDGEKRERTEQLFFKLHNGEIIEWRHDMQEKAPTHLRPVAWEHKLTEKYIAEAIANQIEDPEDHIKPNEKFTDLNFDWRASKLVRLEF